MDVQTDFIWVNLKTIDPTFYKFISICIYEIVIFNARNSSLFVNWL